MNTLEFISSLIHSLAWPLVILVIVILLKEHVIQVIYSIRRISYRNVRVDVGERLSEIEYQTETEAKSFVAEGGVIPKAKEFDHLRIKMEEIAATSPRAAILYTWSVMEKELEQILGTFNVPNDASNKMKSLKKNKLLDSKSWKLLNDLKGLYEDIEAGPSLPLTQSEAIRYCELCQRVLIKLNENTK
ncbi:hypothetical protein [Alkalicoccobacillus murimartini]|uniref:DUF4129 domain-containing protein n=1 Tax=Alkalicoccobacillus murimartini TaxID=171685 RepID=A0ABT9YHU0_9BACI|nr:hypothetical protein [Alkalicoccobacillus murimartini]MDQ0207430.1 hypothetical protein [Alkalicoccobacillus murimartini]